MPVFFNPAAGLTANRIPCALGGGRLGDSLATSSVNGLSISAPGALRPDQMGLQISGSYGGGLSLLDGTVYSGLYASSSGGRLHLFTGISSPAAAPTNLFTLLSGGQLLSGTATDSTNGRFQLASHSALTGGVAFGTDATGLETLWRHSAGILRTAGTLRGGNVTADGYVRGGVQVVADTGATRTLTADESGALFTNDGGGSAITFTLPSAAAGLRFRFCNLSTSYAVAVTAAAGDTIVDDGSETVTGGTITSSAGGVGLGETLELIAVNATRWVVASKNGTWT
jgi:hypothetical protein